MFGAKLHFGRPSLFAFLSLVKWSLGWGEEGEIEPKRGVAEHSVKKSYRCQICFPVAGDAFIYDGQNGKVGNGEPGEKG